MNLKDSIEIRLLTLDDLEDWLEQCIIVDDESGKNDIYFGPYSKNEVFPTDEIRKKTIDRWCKPIDMPNWRKAWGIFHRDKIVGNAQIAAGDLPTNLHRVDLGIGILKEYRNKGLGKRLLNTIIKWCIEQPSIHWIDLGVFSGNKNAKALFEKIGFRAIGFKEDCWLIDGRSISETSMAINVK